MKTNTINCRTITCKSGPSRVTTLVVERDGVSFYAIKGGHTVFKTEETIKSGRNLYNIDDIDAFTYYGDGTDSRPDNVADMKTLLWLIRDKE